LLNGETDKGTTESPAVPLSWRGLYQEVCGLQAEKMQRFQCIAFLVL
jgi:hypothetical protein